MQYLLTQEELDKLVPKKDLDKATEAITHLRGLLIGDRCCQIRTKPGTPKVKDKMGYCDQCPLSHLRTPSSQERTSRELSLVLCPLSRHYSK